MGYCTYFTIDVYKSKKEINIVDVLEFVKEKIEELSDYDFELVDSTLCSGERIKWYSHKEDMLKISIEASKKFDDTDLVFMVTGEGEEAPDFWREYFKNGKMQTCCSEVVYEPYDENKFK